MARSSRWSVRPIDSNRNGHHRAARFGAACDVLGKRAKSTGFAGAGAIGRVTFAIAGAARSMVGGARVRAEGMGHYCLT